MLGKSNIVQLKASTGVSDIENLYWTKVESGTRSNIKKAYYENGYAIAITEDGKILYSNDGEIWTLKELDVESCFLSDMIFDGEKFIFVGSHVDTGNTYGLIAYTTDFTSFTLKTKCTESLCNSSGFGGIYEKNGAFYLLTFAKISEGYSGEHVYLYKTDLTTFTKITKIDNFNSSNGFELDGYNCQVVRISSGFYSLYRIKESSTKHLLKPNGDVKNEYYIKTICACADELYKIHDSSESYKITKIDYRNVETLVSTGTNYDFKDILYIDKNYVFLNAKNILVVKPGEKLSDKTIDDLVEVAPEDTLNCMIKAFDKIYLFGNNGCIISSTEEFANNETASVINMSGKQALKQAKEYTNQKISEIEVQGAEIATESTVGIVKPDGTTIIIDEDGTIHSVGGGEETDPTVPEWVKQPTKPSYTAEEVGALPNTTAIPSALSDLTEDEAHRTVTEAEKQYWNAKSDFSGSYNDLTDIPTNQTESIQIATTAEPGIVKPDGITITVDEDGTIHSVGGGTSVEVSEHITEATGDSIHITDSKEGELVVTDFEKNLISYPYFSNGGVRNGITWTVNDDGTITANGTATANSVFTINPNSIPIKVKQGKKYRYNGCPIGGSIDNYRIDVNKNNASGGYISQYGRDYGDGLIITPTSDNEGISAYIYIISGQTAENIVFKPMLVEVAEDGTYPTEYIPPMGYEITACGQNLIPFPYYDGSNKTHNGITFTVNDDGTIIANGTATALSEYIMRLRPVHKNFLTAGNYVLSGCPMGGSKDSYRLWFGLHNGTSWDVNFFEYGERKSFVVNKDFENDYVSVYVQILTGQTVENLVFKPMIVEVDSDGTYPTEYQPYKGTKVTVSADTKAPLYGLKAIEGTTNVFNSYGAKMKVIYPVTKAGQHILNNDKSTNAELKESVAELQSEIENVVSDAWNSTITYTVGQYCIYNNSLWKCKVQHSNQAPIEGDYWEMVSVASELISCRTEVLATSDEVSSNTESGKIADALVTKGIISDVADLHQIFGDIGEKLNGSGCKYIKIGSLVTVRFEMTINGDVALNSLPFTNVPCVIQLRNYTDGSFASFWFLNSTIYVANAVNYVPGATYGGQFTYISGS